MRTGRRPPEPGGKIQRRMQTSENATCVACDPVKWPRYRYIMVGEHTFSQNPATSFLAPAAI